MALEMKKSNHRIMDRERVLRLAEALNRSIGFVPDPHATAERAQALSQSSGIRPEDNEFSRAILQQRQTT